ncbi:MAG: transposase [Gammaproteobacteria bacterium]|nr:transposase [Gammaproteobacteria bacterium]
MRKIKHGKKEREYRNSAKKPWLIASSLELPAEKIMAIYRKRMKIEHDFRDTKDPRWGLGIRESRTKDPARLILQLLIGFLATFILWLIGLCLERKGLHRDFQANSIKHKRVLSLVFLTLEAIRSGYMKFISMTDLLEIKKEGLYDATLCG